MEKSLYLQCVADIGSREVLLVKMADRLFNSQSFADLRGVRCAFCYLHEADCLLPALQKFSDDSMIQNALAEWKNRNDSLYEDARKDAIQGCLLGGAVGKNSITSSTSYMPSIGLFFDPQEAYNTGCRVSAISNLNSSAIISDGILAMLISLLRDGIPLWKSLDLIEEHLQHIPNNEKIFSAVRTTNTSECVFECGNMSAPESILAVSIYCALSHKWDFSSAVSEAARILNNSIASFVTGSIIGVQYGASCIPDKY